MKNRPLILKDGSAQQRAYTLLSIKSVDDDKRVITGIATTPTPDRYGDIVEPKGAQFKLPLPFLWQHNSAEPIGHVTKAKVGKDGIEVTIELAKIDEPGRLKDRLDEAWQAIKAGLVRGLSIGFTSIESTQIDGSWSRRFVLWEWLELSAVTIPANADCSIQSVKSIDTALRASHGPSERKARGPVRLDSSPGEPGATRSTTPKSEPQEGIMNHAEYIKALEAKRAALVAKIEGIQKKAMDENRGKDAAESEEFDNSVAELDSVDKELDDARKTEKILAGKLAPVASSGGTPPTVPSGQALAHQGAQARGGNAMVIDRKLPPGVGFARYAGILAASRGSISDAVRLAKERFPDETRLHVLVENHGRVNEMVGKAATDIGTTTDSDYASPLVYAQNLVSEFLEFLRPQTIVGRIQNLRRVPFNVRVPRQTSGGSASWVGEAKPKPVTSTALDYVELKYKKLATIAVISQELARFSSPSAEMIIRDTLAGAIIQQMDADFVDPTNAGSANVKPASITYGVSPVASSGDTEDRVREDVRAIFAPFIAANLSPRNGVWIMSATNALSLSLMVNALGQTAFPGITMDGGTFFGMPVVVSEAVGNIVVLANASDILVADDGGITIDTSNEASVQMDSAPDDPASASTVYVSLWQRNLLGIRAERFIDWVKGRAAAVQYLSGVEWGLEST